MVAKRHQFKSKKSKTLGLLGQKAEFFVASLLKYHFNYNSEKINSIARLTKLGIPTVPYPHFLTQEAYLFYLKNRSFPKEAIKGLRAVFQEIKKHGYTIAVRPSIFALNIPGFEFIVPNKINLPTFKEVKTAIIEGYEKIITVAKNPEDIEFVYIIQGFYTSNRCGLAQSEDGTNHIHIEAAFGEHSMVITRGEVQPDIYKFDKSTGEIIVREVADKNFTLEPSKTGLVKVPLPSSERKRQVLNKDEIKTLTDYALRMEKKYGPQEIEWAVLRTGQLIFQSTRNAKIKKLKGIPTKNIPIFSGKAEGELIFLRKFEDGQNLTGKIVVTDNLNIDFMTNLTYKTRPDGVVLTQGSLTAHATTIIREAKIPSVLAQGFKIKNQKYIEIKENGELKIR